MNTTPVMKRSLISHLAFAFIAIFLITSCNSKAQTVSSKVQDVNGVSYYIHTVEKGQTLYALSKLYQCDVNDITAANPGTDQGIREGAEIKIPVSKSNVKPPKHSTQVVSNAESITHEVQRKETLYSIAKQYNIDINDLIAANPGSDAGVKKGQVLKIPLKKKAEEVKPTPIAARKHTVSPGETLYGIARQYSVTVESIQQANGGLALGLKAGQELLIPGVDPSITVEKGGTFTGKGGAAEAIAIKGDVFKNSYSIGLMLPFYINYLDTMESREKMLREVALQMYRGAMMASDTLESIGLKANVYTYDVLDGKSSITTALEKPEMKEMDVLIGPTFRDALTDAAVWGSKSGVHVVCPVQQPNKILLSSSNMSKSVASTPTQWITIAKHIYQKYPKENIIIIDSKNIDDRRSVDAFREEWKKLSGDSLKNIIVVTDASNFNVQDKYQSTKKNIIIAPTSDKKVIGTLFRVLGEGEIIVYGNENWDNMEAISIANRNKYNVHYPQTTYIDYSDAKVQKWVESYRKKFKSEPNEYAFLGFDLLMYYGNGLKQFGRAFPNHLSDIKVKNLYAHDFDYIKTGNESGFENQHVTIVGTKDYLLVKEN